MPPISILIKPVSGLCNMKCKYCFYTDVAKQREVANYGIMSLKTLETIVKKALAEAEGYCSFGFQGGEPTLAGIDFYKKLIEFQQMHNVNNIKIYNSIQTNGYEINSEFAKFLAQNNFLVGISIDGYKQIHDEMRIDKLGGPTYDKIIKSAKLFDYHNVQYNILCVVNNLIAKNPIKVYSNLKKFKYLQFIACIDGFDAKKQEYSLNPKLYGEFLKETFLLYYRDYISDNYVSERTFDNYISILMGRHPESCAMNGMCNCYFLIEADGSVFPCDFYVLDKWKLGNINDDSFKEMRETVNAKEFVETSKHIDSECKACRWFALCRGGCRRNREPFFNNKPRLNVYCESYKYFFESCCDGMVEIAKDQLKRIEKR